MDYSRQELVIGKKAQKQLEKSKVAIIGVGALGSLSSELLVRSGVKKLILFDNDFIEMSNLQRQHLYKLDDVNKPKVKVAKRYLKEVNPNVSIKEYFMSLTANNIKKLNKVDLILDCTDNMQTRFLLNDFCVKNKINCVFASAIQEKGYIYVYSPKRPCYGCIFSGLRSIDSCETLGVLNGVSSLVSSLQVNEAIKLLIGKKAEEDLIYVSLGKNDFNKIKVEKRKECKACSGNFDYLDGKIKEEVCGK
ncbi:HesA/MoeB/ThiF family protein [Candidatus Woesearchaeota archaeon]|jgi:molybdopterin/thiamine biosynthesis adenylyltransferase|nr:HesA/MoeB/ThiF family protein [Candidatus Woesearchaeota archaeon]MBT4321671.1 HesA/MoeB/ThiF family protein [Candidatus Woesearchaeota archaeon]MBT4631018.1 HesA/MoeB/ThiF family protein [Candidatus Woesearchaeota archaeon]